MRTIPTIPARRPAERTAQEQELYNAALRRRLRTLAGSVAVIPTALSAYGMVSVCHDLLELSWPVAVALGAFVELALLACALLAWGAAQLDVPGTRLQRATWLLSAFSGACSAMHQCLTDAGGWDLSAANMIGAAVRLAAPLIAAWLWDCVLSFDRTVHAERSLSEVMRTRRLTAIVWAAHRAGRRGGWRGRRARRAMYRAQRRAMLRDALATSPAARTELDAMLSYVGRTDAYPGRTLLVPADLDLEPVAVSAEVVADAPPAVAPVPAQPAIASTPAPPVRARTVPEPPAATARPVRDTRTAVLGLLARTGDPSAEDIAALADALGVTPHTVRRHVRALSAPADTVSVSTDGRTDTADTEADGADTASAAPTATGAAPADTNRPLTRDVSVAYAATDDLADVA